MRTREFIKKHMTAYGWHRHARQRELLIGYRVKIGRYVRTIEDTMAYTPGGVCLDRPIDGLKYWHISECKILGRKK